MKYLITFFISFMALFQVNGQELQSFSEYTGYIPSSLIHIENKGPFFDEFGNIVDINFLKLSDFNHTSTSVIIVDTNENIGGFGITYSKGIYKVIYSFEVFIEVFDTSSNKYRIGAAIEVVSNIKTKKKKLDLSSLFNLAIEAEKNKVSGSLSMTARGFSTDTIYSLFNINASIDKASVQNVLKNVGIMISKFTDNTIVLKPIILGHESKKGTE